MKPFKIVLYAVLLAAAFFGAYAAFMYVYTEKKFAPVELVSAPQTHAPHADWQAAPGQTLYIHQVNTPRRAKSKDTSYNGYELDLLPAQDGGELLVAHDESALKDGVTLADIFAAVKEPGQKNYWLDLKTELSQTQLDEVLATTARFNVPNGNLLFETVPGPTAKLINKNGLGLLLQLPDGFDTDELNPAKRREINEAALALWQEYRPSAVSASFGKYPYLRDYFPNMPKAVYYSATRRPSLKKPFMVRHMKTDPSVKIFMLDEYTW